MDIDRIINTIQDCNINFLLGSGMSCPYLPTLGNIEILLNELYQQEALDNEDFDLLEASILGKYFDDIIYKNLLIKKSASGPGLTPVLNNYKAFLITLNSLILKRKSTILDKQVNLFTTNIDIFLEQALEMAGLENNDGFSGKFAPSFHLSNFNKSLFKKSLHYGNIAEIPVFNLFKVHGSVTWQLQNDRIVYSDLSLLSELHKIYVDIKDQLITITPTSQFNDLLFDVDLKTYQTGMKDFLKLYRHLGLVNPAKTKFQDTTLNLFYYELLRMLSNELEKENTLLIIMGFSAADEHIREILLRAANSNPTLMILVFAYDSTAKAQILANLQKGKTVLRYNNVQVLIDGAGLKYDLNTLNSTFFEVMLTKIH